MSSRNKTIRRVQAGAICGLMLSCALAVSASAQDSAATTTHKQSSSTHSTATSASRAKKTSGKSSGKKSHRKSSRVRGQQKIDAQRAQAIQEALIREHYLKGDATGTWSQASEDAMRKYQADHGWQSKTVPDSRALISLGLGPSKDHLLNPESAMTTVPDAPKSEGLSTASHTTPAAASTPTPTSSAPATSANPSATEPSSPQ
jgi:putative peptidoglycan binding protein